MTSPFDSAPIVALIESYNTPKALIDAVQRRGWQVALLRGEVGSLHHNPSLSQDTLDSCQIVTSCDAEDVESIKAACRQLPKEQLRNILTISEYSVVNASAAAADLGLSFTASTGVKNAKDKFGSKEKLRGSGLLSMRSISIKEPFSCQNEILEFGFPAVLKPRAGAASVQVYILRTAADLEPALATIASGRQQDPSTLQGAFSRQEFVLETYLEGPMLSLEVARARNKTALLTVGQRARAEHDESIEISTLMPGLPHGTTAASLEVFADHACTELGLDKGVFHIECVLTPTGLELIEINPRLMGGSLPVMYSATHAVDIFDLLLDVYLDESAPLKPPKAQLVGVSCFLAPLAAGKVPERFSIASIQAKLPKGIDFSFFKKAGDALDVCRSNHDYIGRLCIYGKNREEVLIKRRDALALVEEMLDVPLAKPRAFANEGIF